MANEISAAHDGEVECNTSNTVEYTTAFLYSDWLLFLLNGISNSNWTEWSTIQGVIARIISKSDEREARDRFEFTSTITP